MSSTTFAATTVAGERLDAVIVAGSFATRHAIGRQALGAIVVTVLAALGSAGLGQALFAVVVAAEFHTSTEVIRATSGRDAAARGHD